MLVFNLPAGAVLALSVGAFAAADYGGLSAWRLVIGFAAMAVVGGALEFKPEWAPRLFWVIPVWVLGALGLGIAFVDAGQPIAGAIALAIGGIVLAVLIARAITRKPGGKWMAGLVGASAVVIGFQCIGYWRPQWKTPLLYAVNATALIAMVVCGVMVYRARRAAT